MVEMDKGKTNVEEMKREMTTGMRWIGNKKQRGTEREISMIRNKRTATVWRRELGGGGGGGGRRETCVYCLSPAVKTQIDPDRGGMEERGKRGVCPRWLLVAPHCY